MAEFNIAHTPFTCDNTRRVLNRRRPWHRSFTAYSLDTAMVDLEVDGEIREHHEDADARARSPAGNFWRE